MSRKLPATSGSEQVYIDHYPTPVDHTDTLEFNYQDCLTFRQEGLGLTP